MLDPMHARAADREDTPSGVKPSEVVGSIAIASDLGLGQPLEHVLRSCVIATRVAERLGASLEDRDATYWAALFAAAGCTGVSFELAAMFGDDIAFRAGVYHTLTNASFLRFAMRRAGGDSGALHRTKARVRLLTSGMPSIAASLLAHCAVSAELARRLDLGDTVVDCLLQTFEQWDGKGIPHKLRGDDVRLPIRIANLTTMVEVHDRVGGSEAAKWAARKGEATVGPELVKAWCEIAEEVLGDVDAESSWQQVIASPPRGRPPLTNREPRPAPCRTPGLARVGRLRRPRTPRRLGLPPWCRWRHGPPAGQVARRRRRLPRPRGGETPSHRVES